MRREIDAPDKEWLTEQEMAAWLGISGVELAAMIRRGDCPRHKNVGNQRRWHWEAAVQAQLTMRNETNRDRNARHQAKLMTLRDVAGLLLVHTDRVRYLVKKHKFPAPMVFAKKRRWVREEVNAWLESQGVPADGDKVVVPAPVPVPSQHAPKLLPAIIIGDDPGVILCDGRAPLGLLDVQGRVKLYNLRFPPCVYFLVKGDTVVYIGQSTHLPTRVLQHQKGSKSTPKKDFDRVFYIPVKKDRLLAAELYFIKLMKPELNMAGLSQKRKAPTCGTAQPAGEGLA